MQRLLIPLVGLVLLSSLLIGCSAPPWTSRPVSILDWVNFIRFHGITYIDSTSGEKRVLQTDDLGPEFATVRFMVSEAVTEPGYELQDGDAAFLPIGTPVYTVKGYSPQFRLAAYLNNALLLFEADTNPAARTGRDMLDIEGKVTAIGINSSLDGTTELGSIKNQLDIERLIATIMQAPVDHSIAMKSKPGNSYMLVFYLADGTQTQRMFWPSSGELSRDIMLPQEFAQAVEASVQE